MADQAKITSIDALESFRSALIVFLTESRRSLDEVNDEVNDEVRRTRMWLEQEQRAHWEAQLRKRQKKLQEAELFGAKLSPLRDQTTKQQEDVRRARRAVAEAEGKLRNVKKWNRDYDSVVEPMTKRLDGLRFFLDHDMIKALAFLVQAQRTLEGYAEVRMESDAPAPPSEEQPQ